MRVGVISDTHDFLDPKVLSFFAGVDHILHGGDIGRPRVILDLETIAPVTAVLGNTDSGLHYKETEIVTLAGWKFLIHHIVSPLSLDDELKAKIDREQADVVVFGHSHKPFCQKIGKVMFFNPGYAGKPRFAMPRTVATLEIENQNLRHSYFSL
jgi:uncharacterized protein